MLEIKVWTVLIFLWAPYLKRKFNLSFLGLHRLQQFKAKNASKKNEAINSNDKECALVMKMDLSSALTRHVNLDYLPFL
jgi:hypothetical protein